MAWNGANESANPGIYSDDSLAYLDATADEDTTVSTSSWEISGPDTDDSSDADVEDNSDTSTEGDEDDASPSQKKGESCFSPEPRYWANRVLRM